MPDSVPKKTIWIINQYASTPDTGMGGRHYYLAREFAKQGHKVYLIAASYTHILRAPPQVSDSYDIRSVDGFHFVWIKMPRYRNAHSKMRMLNEFLFAWRLRGLVRVINDKPDVIMYSSLALIGFLGGKCLSNLYPASRLIFEVRDIWPLTLVELGGYSTKHPFIRLLQWIEDKAYRDSEKVISNLKNAVEHMVGRGMDEKKFAWIPNGFSLDEISLKQNLSDTVLSRIPRGKFIVGYTGTLGVANALDSLIDAADKLKDMPEISFVLVGSGKRRPQLESLVQKKKLTNVVFIDPIPKMQVQTMLRAFDVCFIGWRDNPLYRYGIAANKLPEYLYSGKPVLHAYSGRCDPVKEAGAGITVRAESPDMIAEAILSLYNMPQSERDSMGENGFQYVLENYEYGALADRLADILVSDHD